MSSHLLVENVAWRGCLALNHLPAALGDEVDWTEGVGAALTALSTHGVASGRLATEAVLALTLMARASAQARRNVAEKMDVVVRVAVVHDGMRPLLEDLLRAVKVF